MEREAQSHKITIYAMPEFNLFATLGLIDPFRLANMGSGKTLFEWQFISDMGGLIPTAGGNCFPTEHPDAIFSAPNTVVISASQLPDALPSSAFIRKLRQILRQGAQCIGISSGHFVMAELGLLEDYKATVHYYYLVAFIERYPRVKVTGDSYTIDRKMITCCGGTATVDLGLEILQNLAGQDLADASAAILFRANQKTSDTPQTALLAGKFEKLLPSSVADAIVLMKSSLENPLSIPEICSEVGISQRRLEELFREHVVESPKSYFLLLRLKRGKSLLTQSNLSVSEISLACGFSSTAHFSSAYRKRYGHNPTKERTLQKQLMPKIS